MPENQPMSAEKDAVPHGPNNPCEPKCHGYGIGCPCNPLTAEKDVLPQALNALADEWLGRIPSAPVGFYPEASAFADGLDTARESCAEDLRELLSKYAETRPLPPGQDR